MAADLKYCPEIDGLRAVAVVPVVLFQAGFGVFSGGFVGVDVFFVISGYLITGILLSDIAADRFSILRFYERRARRILPALFAVLLACLPLAWFLLLPDEMARFGKSVLAVLGFVSNMTFWREEGCPAAAWPRFLAWRAGAKLTRSAGPTRVDCPVVDALRRLRRTAVAVERTQHAAKCPWQGVSSTPDGLHLRAAIA